MQMHGCKPKTQGRQTGNVDRTEVGTLHVLLNLPLHDFTALRVSEWMKCESARHPTNTALAFRLFRAFMNRCAAHPDYRHLIASNVCTACNVRDEQPKTTVTNDRLQQAQFGLWFEHVRKLPNPWVFSCQKAASGRLQEPRIGHNKALAAAGLPSLSLHGPRRSFGTLSEWVEVPTGVVAQIMGHKPSAIAEKHYRRPSLDFLRKWHIQIESWILEEAGIELPNQIPIPRLRALG